MKVLQLFYTSCRRGLSTGSGFQTYAMSDGVTEDERKEIERYGVYVPPADLPSQPSPEEIATLFPTAFTFFKLKSGRHGVCQSKYIGQDYSGRYGNYFCHALIFDAPRLPVYPIQYCGAPFFRDNLTEEEMRMEDAPPPPPALELEDLSTNELYRFDEIQEFIQDNRVDMLKRMISSILTHEQSHRRLVLREEYALLPFWIGAIQMSFPLKLAHRLTFSTYAFDPEGTNALIACPPLSGGRFAFSETQRKFEYYIFDLVEGLSSEVEETFKFNQVVDVGFTILKDNLFEFHDFIDHFSYKLPNREIDAAHDLFTISRTGIGEMDAAHVTGAVDFANSYAPPELLGRLSDNIEQIMDTISDSVDFKTAKVITRFLFKVARTTGSQAHLNHAYEFFFNALHHLIVDYREPEKDRILKFNKDINEFNQKHTTELLTQWIEPRRLGTLTTLLSDDDEKVHAEIYFTLMMDNLLLFGATWKQTIGSPGFPELLTAFFDALLRSEKHLSAALQTTSANDEYFAGLILFALKMISNRTGGDRILLNSFASVMRTKNDKSAFNVRREIIQRDNGSFIFREFSMLLGDATKKTVFFWDFYEYLFSRIPEFSEAFFDEAVKNYLKLLQGREFHEECAKMLIHEEEIRKDALVNYIVRELESAAPLSSPRTWVREVTPALVAVKSKRRIETTPDIAGLIDLGIHLENVLRGRSRNSGVEEKPPEIAGADRKKYMDYLKWVAPMLIRLASSPRDHGKNLDYLIHESFHKELARQYTKKLYSNVKKNKAAGLNTFKHFIGYYLTSSPRAKKTFAPLRPYVRSDLVNILSKMSGPRKNKLRRALENSEFISRANLVELENIYRDAEEKYRKSPGGMWKTFLVNRKIKAEKKKAAKQMGGKTHGR